MSWTCVGVSLRDPITLLRYPLSMARCLSDILLEERLSENQRAATGLEISTYTLAPQEIYSPVMLGCLCLEFNVISIAHNLIPNYTKLTADTTDLRSIAQW